MDTLIDSYPLPSGGQLELHIDESPQDPREDDNLGTMVCWHRSYRLGDRNGFGEPNDFMGWWEDEGGEDGVLLPLYLYDHSGITMSTQPFSCPWDSGQVGYIYATREKILEEYKKEIEEEWSRSAYLGIKQSIPKEVQNRVRALLVSEVELYDCYLRGDVYGYIITDADGDHQDSCWGFYGSVETSGILEYLTDEARHVLEGAR